MKTTKHAVANEFSADGRATVLSVHDTAGEADAATEAHNEQYDLPCDVTNDMRAAWPVIVEANAQVGDRIVAAGPMFVVEACACCRARRAA